MWGGVVYFLTLDGVIVGVVPGLRDAPKYESRTVQRGPAWGFNWVRYYRKGILRPSRPFESFERLVKVTR